MTNPKVFVADIKYGVLINDLEIHTYPKSIRDIYFTELVEKKDFDQLLEKYTKLLQVVEGNKSPYESQ